MATSSNLLDKALGIFDNNLSSSSSSSSGLPNGSVVMIQDCVETSGIFVIHHLLKRSLSSPSSVIFLSLSHPFSHYDRILRKLGCNLAAHRDNRRFFFFDLLSLECAGTDRSEEKIDKGGLIELYGKIQRTVEDIASSCESNKHITIIIDDFSLIEVAAKGSLNHSLDFLRYCYTLTSEVGCSLVVLNHEDIYSGENGSSLLLQMEYLANVLIKVEPLATGLAADVHGQLTSLNKRIHDQSRMSANKIQNFHFKLKENGVECFYPGSQT